MEITERVAVAGVLLHQDGKVLLQHRDDLPDIAWPGHWAIFGGHLEPGEDGETCARREIAEELGLHLEGPLELIFEAVNETRHRRFYAAPLLVPPEALTLMEGQGLGLFSAAELESMHVVPLHRDIAVRFLGSLHLGATP